MITGEYRNALDEKGRLMIPARVRQEISGSVLVLTRGIDRCLWLFPPAEWKQISANLLSQTSPFSSKARLIQRKLVAPAQEIEIDKNGRINVPVTLREYAGLKKETIILGIEKYIEIWDETEYQQYLNDNEQVFQEAAEELGGLVSF